MGARLWSLFCSLKLAIVLASLATLLVMGGSLAMHFNPSVFGNLDGTIMAAWWRQSGETNLSMTWWLPLAGSCLLLLGINSLCCFIDWARNWRRRWRKTGEYLIHSGFVLVVIAYVWGSVAGFRSEGNQLTIGETISVPHMPEFSLKLESFEPVLNNDGRPLDMRNTLALYRDGTPVKKTVSRINHPLIWGGLTVIPSSFGQFPTGFQFHWPTRGTVGLEPGTSVELPSGGGLRVLSFYPDAALAADGRVLRGGDRIGNPALEIELTHPYRDPWRGWYFLRGRLPFPLVEAGVHIWPMEPIYRSVSIVTINRDPGSRLALGGGILMGTGVLLAMISFYYKRSRGDRPQVG